MKVMQPMQLVLLDSDALRLKQILEDRATSNHQNYNDLRGELAKARIVSQSELPEDVVIMNSTVQIQDMEDDDISAYTLVYPREADADTCKISILAPIGTALIGYRKGDIIQWKMPGGIRKFKIISVLHPEI